MVGIKRDKTEYAWKYKFTFIFYIHRLFCFSYYHLGYYIDTNANKYDKQKTNFYNTNINNSIECLLLRHFDIFREESKPIHFLRKLIRQKKYQ